MRVVSRAGFLALLGGAPASACGSEQATDGAEESTGAQEESGADEQGSVRVARIEINPGVAIPIVNGDVPVAPEQRNAQIPMGRPALLRVHLDVSESWTARDLELGVQLVDADGDVHELTQTRWIEADSEPGDLESGFAFELAASTVQPGLELALELRDPAALAVRIPATGTYTVGVENDPMRVRLMLVPIAYHSDTCVSDATASEAEALEFADAIVQTFPVQQVELVQRADPVAWNQTLDANWTGLLQKLIDLREIDQVPDDVYYFGIVDLCDEDPPVSAVAAGFPAAGPEGAGLRVAVASKYPTPMGDGGPSGLMFGMGVLHGRLTVACDGGAGLDPIYPYSGGSIGSWGWGVIDGELRDPDQHVDLVAGCLSSARWTSDYTWRGLYDRVRTVTAWSE